jgi:hypothetical protein
MGWKERFNDLRFSPAKSRIELTLFPNLGVMYV